MAVNQNYGRQLNINTMSAKGCKASIGENIKQVNR